MGSLCASPAREQSQASRSGSPQQPEAAAPLHELKMTSLPAGQAQKGAELGLVQMDTAPHAAHRVAPVAVGIWSTRGSLTKSKTFHSKLFTASKFQPVIYKLSVYNCSPDT